MIVDLKQIAERIARSRKKLKEVGVALKRKFVGIDEIIDGILTNMICWHAMPELIGRPVIINLWGMTGVGKTDLVRQLVKELGMADRFVEVQMAVKSSSFDTTIQGVLSSSDVDPDTQGILLLDEMQRFRTVAKNGDDISSSCYDDVWMLLSDGKFASSAAAKKTLLDMVFDDVYYQQQEEEEEEEEAEHDTEDAKSALIDRVFGDSDSGTSPPPARRKKSVVHKYKRSMWSARYLKRLLKLSESAVEIMQWSEAKKQEAVNEALSSQITYEGESYSQLLIFVSGVPPTQGSYWTY